MKWPGKMDLCVMHLLVRLVIISIVEPLTFINKYKTFLCLSFLDCQQYVRTFSEKSF